MKREARSVLPAVGVGSMSHGGSSSALIWQGKVLRSGSLIHNGLGIVP